MEIGLSRAARGWVVCVLAVLVAVTGCARSPEAQKARYLDRGDKYFAQGQYREAIIEYRNVLRAEPANVRVTRQLGLAHYQLGEAGSAFDYLQKSQRLDPTNVEVRQKLAAIYLLGGRPAEAQREAALILEQDPRNVEALAVLGGGARTPEEITAAIRRQEEAGRDVTDGTKLHLALGSLHHRQQD